MKIYISFMCMVSVVFSYEFQFFMTSCENQQLYRRQPRNTTWDKRAVLTIESITVFSMQTCYQQDPFSHNMSYS